MTGTRLLIVGVLLCGVLSGSSRADLQLSLSRGYGSGPGGEFRATVYGWPESPLGLGEFAGFETFCLQKNESIKFGVMYYAQLNTEAVSAQGSVSSPPNDPLDAMTAYLYQQFIDGVLSGYDYGAGSARVASANALQDVIWYIEDEQDMNWVDGDGSLRDLFYQDALLNAGDDIGEVRVLNMFTNASMTKHAQDQLVSFAAVPLPGAVWMGLVGFSVAGLLRRRGKKEAWAASRPV